MAINLDVKGYCSECCDFDPDVIKPERRLHRIDENTVVNVQTGTIIRCKYAKRCENSKRYVDQHQKGENHV